MRPDMSGEAQGDWRLETTDDVASLRSGGEIIARATGLDQHDAVIALWAMLLEQHRQDLAAIVARLYKSATVSAFRHPHISHDWRQAHDADTRQTAALPGRLHGLARPH